MSLKFVFLIDQKVKKCVHSSHAPSGDSQGVLCRRRPWSWSTLCARY